MKPKISVIIPIFNAEPFLGKCLDSVLSQDIDKEVICVDDSSSDGSCAVVESYVSRGERIRLIRNFERRNAGVCRNVGLAVATGEYVHFLDADDFLVDGAYERLYAVASENRLDILRCDAYLYDDKTGVVSESGYYSAERGLSEDIFTKPLRFNDRAFSFLKTVVTPWAGLWRRAFLSENHLEFNNLRCVNDRSFYFDAMTLAERILFIRDHIVHYRTNNSKSLIGCRAAHFDCQVSSYRLMERIAERLPADIRLGLLNAELSDIRFWVAEFVRKGVDLSTIRGQLAQLLAEMDVGHWQDVTREFWYRSLKSVADGETPPVLYRVSVVMPVYNAERYLAACLDSYVRQTLTSVEVICVDDGSQDGSWPILEQYASRHRNIKAVRQENAGAGAARNRGLQMATGEYALVVDADDFCRPDMLARMAKTLDECPEADFTAASCFLYDDRQKKVMYQWPISARVKGLRRPFTADDLRPYAFEELRSEAWNKLFRMSFIRSNNLSFQEDVRGPDDVYFTTMAVALAKGITVTDGAFYFYRRNTGAGQMDLSDGHPFDMFRARQAINCGLRDAGRGDLLQDAWSATVSSCMWHLLNKRSVDVFRDVYGYIRGGALDELRPEGADDDLIKNQEARRQYDVLVREERPDALLLDVLHSVQSARMDTAVRNFEILCERNKRGVELNSSRRRESDLAGRQRILSAESMSLRKEVCSLKDSESYKVGMFVTWPLRMFACGIRFLIKTKGRGLR